MALTENQYKTMETIFDLASPRNKTEWVDLERVSKKLEKTPQRIFNTLFKLQQNKFVETRKLRGLKEFEARLTPFGIMNLATSNHNPYVSNGNKGRNKFDIFVVK